MSQISNVAMSGAIGITIAIASSLVTLGAAVWSTKRSWPAGSVGTTMSLKLVVLAGLFWCFQRLGLAMGPLMIGFGVAYTISLAVTVFLFTRGRGK